MTTIEPLDLCLKRELIDVEAHQAGIRLRWLYTLCFGSPDVSAYHPENIGGSCLRSDDERWLHACHLEYKAILCALEKINAKRIIMNICVFNQYPAFLRPCCKDISTRAEKLHRSQFIRFNEGMELLISTIKILKEKKRKLT